ncbi:hypothetical protein, partial [Vibrio parahaemolyticus]|uniref:hypothetical protein n=1 Tax=Vibrio parahaemolyticus TaxID=670 RepID=UPI001C5DB80A
EFCDRELMHYISELKNRQCIILGRYIIWGFKEIIDLQCKTYLKQQDKGSCLAPFVFVSFK